MTQNIERIKDTIRKLLDLSRDNGAYEGEINSAIKFARKLLNEHHLTEADLGQTAQSSEDEIRNAECDIFSVNTIGGKSYGWEGSLATFVCKFVGGVKVYQEKGQIRRNNGMVKMGANGKPENCTIFKFYGLVDDARFAQETYGHLSSLISSMALLRWGSVFKGPGRNYSEGFVEGLNEQIKKADNEQAVSDSRALVIRRDAIVKAKENRAEIWIKKEKGMKLGKGGKRQTSYASFNNEARNNGINDGRNTEINGRSLQLGNQRRIGN